MKNDAYSGAESGYENYYFPNWSGILWQIETYLDTQNQYIPSSTLIGLQSGGANDFFATNPPGGAAVATNTVNALKKLALAGARKILLLNIMDFSIVPALSGDSLASYRQNMTVYVDC